MRVEPGKILVVDDNRLNRMKLSRGLAVLGHEAVEVEDGPRALEMLARSPFDMVLLDILMPGMDGFQVLERIRAAEQYQELAVVMTSAVDEMESISRCMQMGADDYLLKPFDATLLKARIDSCLERQQLRRAVKGP